MKSLLTISLLFLYWLGALGQQSGPAQKILAKPTLVNDTLKYDSLKQRAFSIADSLGRMDQSLLQQQDVAIKKLAFVFNAQNPDSTAERNAGAMIEQKLDSVKPKMPIQLREGVIAQKQEALEARLKSKISNDKIEDKLQTSPPRLNGSGSVDQKLQHASQQIATNYVDLPATPSQVKSNALQSLQGKELQLPNSWLPDKLPLPQNQIKLPKVELNLPDVKEEIPDTDSKMPDVQLLNKHEALNSKIEDVSKQSEILSKNLADVKGAQEEGQAATQKIAGQKGDVGGTLEKKAEDAQVTQDLKRKLAPITAQQMQYEAMLAKYKNEKLVEEELRSKTKNIVNDQFNQDIPQVTEAQQKLAAPKRLLPKGSKWKEGFKKAKENIMADKPTRDRLVPGIAMQAYNRSVYMMDIGPQLGYKLTGYFTAGVGANSRIGFSKKYDRFVRSMQVYSGRVYADVMIRSGIFAHGEYELLKCHAYKPTTGEKTLQNISGSNIGLGRNYNLSPQVRGYAMVLYRLEFNGHLPEQTKLNVRLGFSLDLKKRKTTTINNVTIKL